MRHRRPVTPPGRRWAPRPVVVVFLVALALAACTGDGAGDDEPSPDGTAGPATDTSPSGPTDGAADEPSAPFTTPPASEVAALTFTRCEAPEYTIPYPESWAVNDTSGINEPCRAFHPTSVELPDQAQARGHHWAVSVHLDDAPFEQVVPDRDDPQVTTYRETTAAGRTAVVLDRNSTGDALLPAGERQYTWIVGLERGVLVATTTTVGDTDYERDQLVLDG